MILVVFLGITIFAIYRVIKETEYNNEARDRAIKNNQETYTYFDVMNKPVTMDTKSGRIIHDELDPKTGDTIRTVGGKRFNYSQQKRSQRWLKAKKCNPLKRTACLYQRENERSYDDLVKRGWGNIYADLLGEKGDLYFIRNFLVSGLTNPYEWDKNDISKHPDFNFYMRLRDGHLVRVTDGSKELYKEWYEKNEKTIQEFIINFNKQQDINRVNNRNDPKFVEKFYYDLHRKIEFAGDPEEFEKQYDYGKYDLRRKV